MSAKFTVVGIELMTSRDVLSTCRAKTSKRKKCAVANNADGPKFTRVGIELMTSRDAFSN